MDIKKLTIVGKGAVGLLYGSIAAAALGAGAVEYVMDDARLARHAGEELRVNGEPIDLPNVGVSEAHAPADLVLVCVKATGLDAAMDTMEPLVGPRTRIVSLLNGITSEGRLAERFGWGGVVPATAQGLDATFLGGELTYGHAGHIHIGRGKKTDPEAVDDVARFFAKAAIPYLLEKDIDHRLWAKLMLNVGVNQTCMVYSGTYGSVVSVPEQRRCFVAAMREVRAVAATRGIDLTEAELTGMVRLCESMSPEGMPSMAQDRVARRRTEVEEFAGTITRLGREADVMVPQNEWLYERVREIEASWGA